MKRISGILLFPALLVALVASCSSQAPSSAPSQPPLNSESEGVSNNLLENGGFESTAGWFLYPEASVVTGGRSSASALQLSGNWSAARQDVWVLPNSEYLLSGWVRSLDARDCGISFKGAGSTNWDERPSSSSSAWTYLERKIKTPSSVLWAQVMPSTTWGSSTTPSCLFDDLSLTDVSTVPQSWNLIWSDKFEGQTLDPSKWNITDAPATINGELPYFKPQNVSVAGGNLVFKTAREAFSGREFTSGHVNTKGKLELLYGRIEVRALLPKGRGVKADMWTLHKNCAANHSPCAGYWPPELDILEMLGQDPSTVYQSAHYGKAYHARWPENTFKTVPFVTSDTSSNWHVYSLEWEPDEVRFYVDKTLTHKLRDTDIGYTLYDEAMFLILDTTVGGSWAGPPDSSTVFPQYTKIDYVRVYQNSSAN